MMTVEGSEEMAMVEIQKGAGTDVGREWRGVESGRWA